MEAIANRLGISKTTVHYALRDTGRVSDSTRKRVRQVAAELGYRPNLIASSLRSQRSATVGVVVVSLTSSFHARVLEGIEGIAQEEHHGILLSCSHGRADKEREHVDLLLDKGVDGLIVAAADPEENRDYYGRLVDQGISLVFVDRYVPGLNVSAVSSDNLMGTYQATQHLLGIGRNKVAFLTTNSRDRRSTSVQARLSGCLRALREAGFSLAATLGPNVPDKTSEEEFGFDAVAGHLEPRGPAFDAILAVHDGLAYGAIEALVENGLKVPQDVSVVGFDDQDTSAYYHPPLTTVRQPMRQIGEEAARLLFRCLKKSEHPLPRQTVLLEPQLIVRRSTIPKTVERPRRRKA
jgi:LacI family transcriptional regulator